MAAKDKIGAPKQFRFVRGDTGTKEVYEVTAQNKLVEFHDTQTEALTAHRNWSNNPHYVVDGVQQRENLAPASPRTSSSQMRKVFRTMENGAKFKDMSPAQQATVKQALQEMSLGFLSSTAPQNRSMPRRNILGASREFDRNVAEYASTSSRAIANLEIRPQIDQAIKALEDYSNAHKNESNERTIARSQLLQQIRDSVNNLDTGKPTRTNKYINYALTLSFLRHLASPAYHVINALQPAMITGPVIGGRHGMIKAYAELARAYKTMGALGAFVAGTKDMAKTMKSSMAMTTNYIEDIDQRLASEPDGAELTKLMDYFYSTGRINKDAGFEVAEMINHSNNFEKVLHYGDRIARQWGIAVEVINRATTGIAAYRLERARGASIAEAQHYAQEVLVNTQGDYSYANSAAPFKNPIGRVMLQFKQFAQMQYFLLAKLSYNVFKGATPQEKIQAAKSLAGLLTAHMVMAGALGLPTEPIKLTLMLLGMFFPSMPSMDDIERDVTRQLQALAGPNIGDALSYGLPRLMGIDLHSRIGMNSLLIFGAPQKDDLAHAKSWMFDLIAGAPVGMGVDAYTGVMAAENGDWSTAAEKIIPIKFVTDAVKAAREMNVGKVNKKGVQTQDKSGVGDAALRVLGFKPSSVARNEESKGAAYADIAARKAETQTLRDNWAAATGVDRVAAKRAIDAFNKTVPKNAQITAGSLAKSLKTKAANKKKGYTVKGVYGGKQAQDILTQDLGGP